MAVTRIVATVASADPSAADAFYRDALGLHVVMDHGWIRTYAAAGGPAPQVSIATEGGSGTPVPDMSIEVDDVDAVFSCMRDRGFAVEYGPVDEPWGVRRFYVRDPFGKLVNILAHLSTS